MKPKPTKQQVSEFMEILDEESKTVLVVGEYVSAYQLLAIKEYGEFLALMPRDKYKEEIFFLTGKIKDYNLHLEKIGAELISPKQFTVERRKLQKKAPLCTPFAHPLHIFNINCSHHRGTYAKKCGLCR